MDLDRMRKFYGKRIGGLFKEPGRPVVIVFREKHSDNLISCLDRGELEEVCLRKLWERFHMGYYGSVDDASKPPPPPPFPEADIESMPSGMTRRAASEEWKRYEVSRSRHADEAVEMETVMAALRDRDGTIAFAVLQNRSDGEYEGFEVEPGRKIDLLAGDLLGVKPDWVSRLGSWQ